MSKKTELLEDFIKLRIEGKSFAEIAETLKVNKATLIEWNKEALTRNIITEGRLFFYDELVKSFQFDRRSRVEALLKLSKRINTELENRDLKDVPTEKLIKMAIENEGRLENLPSGDGQIGTNPAGFDIDGENADGYFWL